MPEVVGFDEAAKKRVTCDNCAAMLIYTPSEVKEYHGKDYSGGSDGREWIDCPNCKAKVILRSW